TFSTNRRRRKITSTLWMKPCSSRRCAALRSFLGETLESIPQRLATRTRHARGKRAMVQSDARGEVFFLESRHVGREQRRPTALVAGRRLPRGIGIARGIAQERRGHDHEVEGSPAWDGPCLPLPQELLVRLLQLAHAPSERRRAPLGDR